MKWCMCTHLLIGLWRQWGLRRRRRGWSFHLSLCVCMDLLLSASCLLLPSGCLNTHVQKSPSGHFWTTVPVLLCWTWYTNTSCRQLMLYWPFISPTTLRERIPTGINVWDRHPMKAYPSTSYAASRSHFSVSKHLLATIITPVTPFPSVLHCQWWQLHSFCCPK